MWVMRETGAWELGTWEAGHGKNATFSETKNTVRKVKFEWGWGEGRSRSFLALNVRAIEHSSGKL